MLATTVMGSPIKGTQLSKREKRPPWSMPRADGAGFNRDVRDAVNIIGGYSKL